MGRSQNKYQDTKFIGHYTVEAEILCITGYINYCNGNSNLHIYKDCCKKAAGVMRGGTTLLTSLTGFTLTGTSPNT